MKKEGCTWYFSEGCTRGGFEEWLALFNPGSDDLVVTVTYMVSEGANRERIYALPRAPASTSTSTRRSVRGTTPA